MLAGGSIAFVAHGTKATTRLAINASPEPFSNWTASITEDIAVLGAYLDDFNHPFVMLISLSPSWLSASGSCQKFFASPSAASPRCATSCAAASRIKPRHPPAPQPPAAVETLGEEAHSWNMFRLSQPPSNALPATPLTLDGLYLLHQMFRVRWSAWKGLGRTEQNIFSANATVYPAWSRTKPNQPGLSLLGHKGDLMFVHFRKKLDDLNHVNFAHPVRIKRISRADHFLSLRGRAGSLRSFGETLRGLTRKDGNPAPRLERRSRS